MSTSLHTPIAVVGMACLLPGAEDVEAFWQLLMDGRDAIVEMPPARLDRELYYDERKGQRGKTYSSLGGLVPERPPRSASEHFDACHRLFCDVARQALEPLGDLRGRPVGVYVGHSGGTSRPGELAVATLADQIYALLEQIPGFAALPEETRRAIQSQAAAGLRADRPRRAADGGPWLEARWSAELVAAELGLTGPNLVVDAACASSLVALALGAMALERGDIEAAVVGGASYAKADSLLLFSQAQSCSARGTRPFDEEADGLIGSEGYVALVLKTEARARQDGDEILAVIRGVGLSSDGRGRHLWAPQPEGQMAALRRAYGDVLEPGSIQYIEAHATSTQVGDATELRSLGTFFGPHLRGKLPIGSVKSNLGHTLETAGLAAVLKVILAMRRGVIPSTANVQQLNRTVDWDQLPLEVARQERPWPRPESGPRRAGVSAFGIGGLNVHLVLEEPGAPLPPPVPRPEVPVAIVGRGLVLPGAYSLKEFQERRTSALGPGPESRSGCGRRGGFITGYRYDYLKHRVPPKQIAQANPLQFMLLDATEQALGEAGPIDRAETTVVVGTQFGGEFGNALVAGLRFPEIERHLRRALADHGAPDVSAAFEQLFFERYPAMLDETGSFTSSTLASRITKTFDFEGGALALEAGECSGLVALGIGASLLRGGVCQSVICAGAQHSLDLPAYETMERRGAFDDPDYAPGEGVGVVLLKRLEDALRDGNPVHGVLVGEGTGYAFRDPARASELATRRALESGGLRAEEVLAVEPGGALAPVRPGLSQGLQAIYGQRARRRSDLLERFGHLNAAEGPVSIIQATLDPREGVEAHHGVSDSGQASQVLLAAPPAPPRPDQRRSKLRVGAGSFEELVSRLQQPGVGSEEPFRPHEVHRCVLLSKNPAEMPAKLQLVRTQLERRALLEEQGIYLGRLQERPRVAFMFSGQGSQYPGMLRELVALSPAARGQMERADACLSAEGLESFAVMAWGDPERLDADPVTTQVAVLVADMIVLAALTEAGFEADCVAGHSFGEIPALVAAGVLTLEAAVRVTVRRARGLLEASPDGGLLSVQASAETVRELMAGHPLYLTHCNAPEQTVVGGRLPDLERFQVVLSEHQLKARALKVPGALHTPLVAAAQAPLREALGRESLLPPTRLFYSNVTNSRVLEPGEVAQNLVAQLTDPIRYPELLERMVADGVTVFLEVGPSQVLTGLHRQILGPEAVVVSSDHPRRGAAEQLERARAALEVVGALSGQPPLTRPLVGAGEVVEFDATTARKQRKRAQAAQAPVEAPEPVAAPATGHDPALARLLIDFVVDLTGYPAEVISLDWDLEADLGIDSIKRAQLVGEVSEALSLGADGGNLSLDSFRTLRQILDFVESSGNVAARVLAPESETVRDAFQKGLEHGRRYADSIRARLRQNAELGRARADMRSPEELRASLSSEQLAELKGMAEGAGVHVGNLLAYRARWGEAPGNGSTALPTPERPTHRYVLRMVSAPQPEGFPRNPAWQGAALVLGDNPLARELEAELTAQGVRAHVLPATPEAPEQLERLWAEEPIMHLFLATPHDANAVTELSAEAWEKRRAHVLMTPFWLCQRWLNLVKAAGRMEDASLVGFTTLGGDFGFTSRLESFEGGALTGLLKAILVESWVAGFRNLPVKLIDARPDEAPRALVEMALGELAVPSYDVEIGLDRNLRRVVRPKLETLDRAATRPPSGRWVCTGGARGITAFVAGELGRRYGLELHLLGRVGRAEVPAEWRELWPERRRELKLLVMDSAREAGKNPVKTWENAQKSLEIEDTLAELAARGVQAHYHACEISDRAQLGGVLEAIRAHGPITGVLHGAGVSRDCKFEHKDPERVDACFRAKIDGTLALMELTGADPLQHFVAFGSISGRCGANGHTDYSLANDMEAKLVDWYRAHRPEVAAVTFHWHAWGDVGMAVKAEAQLGLQLVDLHFMPAAEGLEHLVRELEAGAPEPEILITDERYFHRFYPGTMEGERPLLGDALSIALDPEKESFLLDHRLDERPIMPLVVSLELAAEAGVPAGAPFCLRSIEALNGLRFPNAAPRTVSVRVEGDVCTVVSDVTARDGTTLERDRPVLRAVVDRAPAGLEGARPPAPPAGEWRPVAYLERESARLYHGPAFRALRKVLLDGEELWGRITAPSPVDLGGPGRPTRGWRIPCAAMDACMYAVGYLAYCLLEPSQAVPAAIGELRVERSPHPRESCLVHVLFRGKREGRAQFDFCLYGANGDRLLEARGYELSFLGSAALV